jgi:hypothetical protein
MADQEMIEEKIGEALGLEKAAQKAIEDLDSDYKHYILSKVCIILPTYNNCVA